MANYSVLILEDIVRSFSMVGHGIDCKVTFTLKSQSKIFDGAIVGDKILGFIDSPKQSFCYLLTVVNIIDSNNCVLEKEFETNMGLLLNDASQNVRDLILSKKGQESLISISEDDYNDIIDKMLDCTKTKMILQKLKPHIEIKFKTGYTSPFERNRILFGAPGTGKSFTLNMDREKLVGKGNESDYERVTFHPDYSYANFIGTYKPVPCKDSDDKEVITYEYVPGPFMRTLVKALQNSKTDNIKPYLLIVEEINRANVAAVFGDVFQLLDRGEDGVSEYPITTSLDMRTYLAKEENLGGNPEDYEKIKIPDNMFIWATMNSADQGVYPMDTAFKRRWDFTYLGIDKNEDKIQGKFVTLGTGEYERNIEWNELRKVINDELSLYKLNEDKLLGPYFLSKKIIPETEDIDQEKFIDAFVSKVIMYLFDDAAKQKRSSLFQGCKGASENALKYSCICDEFRNKGVFIFNNNISDKFPITTMPKEANIE